MDWNNMHEGCNPLWGDSVKQQVEDNWDFSEGRWNHVQYTGREMSRNPVESLSNGQYYYQINNRSPAYSVCDTSASYSASPPQHHTTPVTPAIAIPRVLPLTPTSPIQMSPPTRYHRAYSGNSIDTAYFSPLEPTSPFSGSITDATPISRSPTTNMPLVPGHGLASYDEHSLRCLCGSEFKGAKAKNSRSNFKRHLKTKGTHIPCPLCDKVFNRQDNVQQHIRTRHK